MTKEEIKKNAKEYASKNYEIIIDNWDSFVTSEEFLEQGHIDGAESRQSEIDKACELLKKLKYHIPHLPEWDADYEDEERLRCKVEEFLKEQGIDE